MATTDQTVESTVKRGIDLEALGAFVEYAAGHPDESSSEWQAVGFSQNKAGHSLARVNSFTAGGELINRDNREYTLSFGMPEEMGDALGFVGSTDRMKSTEAALAALAGCISGTISVGAVASGIELDNVQTRVSVEYDPSVLLGIDDVDEADTTFGDLRIAVEVDGESVDEDDLAAIEELVQRSPVYTLLALANSSDTSVEVAG